MFSNLEILDFEHIMRKSTINISHVIPHLLKQLEKGDLEIPYGTEEKSSNASREVLNEIFEQINCSFP